MTLTEETIKKPKSKKRFTTTYAEIDTLFAEINEELMSRNLLKYHQYKFDEKSMTHEIIVDQDIKYTRREGDVAVYSERLRGAGQNVLGPCMWPVSKSLNANASFALMDQVRDVVRDKMSKFIKNNSDFIKKIGQDEWNKRRFQVETVIQKAWFNRDKLYRQKSFFACTKIWWDCFVDRSLLKTCVAILGSSSKKAMTYEEYAKISSQPNLKDIISHVNQLGPEKALLSIESPETWMSENETTLISQSWRSVWSEVKKEPASLQQFIVTGHDIAVSGKNKIGVLVFSAEDFDVPVAKTKSGQEWEEKSGTPLSWALYEAFRSESNPKISKRQKYMMLAAADQLSGDLRYSSDYRDYWAQRKNFKELSVEEILKNGPEIGKWMEAAALLWRDVHKKEYASWSYGHRASWISFAKNIIIHSLNENKLTFPDDQTHTPYKVLWDKKVLADTLKDVKKSKKSVARRL